MGEWHLDFDNSVRHFTFELPARSCHLFEPDGPAFSLSRFKAVGTISHAVTCDRIEQLLVKVGAKRSPAMPLKINERLERFECLQSPFEADRARLGFVFGCGLRHDCPDQIVGEQVRPDFFVNEFGCFAAQDVHLHRGLDRA